MFKEFIRRFLFYSKCQRRLFKKRLENRLEPAFFKGKLPKRVSETLVEVAGIEPASRNLSDSASTRVVHLLILA